MYTLLLIIIITFFGQMMLCDMMCYCCLENPMMENQGHVQQLPQTDGLVETCCCPSQDHWLPEEALQYQLVDCFHGMTLRQRQMQYHRLTAGYTATSNAWRIMWWGWWSRLRKFNLFNRIKKTCFPNPNFKPNVDILINLKNFVFLKPCHS